MQPQTTDRDENIPSIEFDSSPNKNLTFSKRGREEHVGTYTDQLGGSPGEVVIEKSITEQQ